MSEQLIRMTKCLRDIHIYDEALWPTCPFCTENRRVADELQRLRAENAALNISLQATYDERQEVLGGLRAEVAQWQSTAGAEAEIVEGYAKEIDALRAELAALQADASKLQDLVSRAYGCVIFTEANAQDTHTVEESRRLIQDMESFDRTTASEEAKS